MMITRAMVYRGISNGQWRWVLEDYRNGRVIGVSSESYIRRIDCVRNLYRVTGETYEYPPKRGAFTFGFRRKV